MTNQHDLVSNKKESAIRFFYNSTNEIDDSSWNVLGHYDRVQILTNWNANNEANESNLHNDSYNCLFLYSDESLDLQKMKQYAFLLIVKVRFVGEPQTPKELKNEYMNLEIGTNLEAVCKTDECNQVILLFSSDSIVKLMDLLETITESIDETYSYLCYQNHEDCILAEDDSLPLASIRFSVNEKPGAATVFHKSIKKYCEQFEQERDKIKKFFVTGTDDYNMFLHDFSSKDLILFIDGIYNDINLRKLFVTSVTRLGIGMDDTVFFDSSQLPDPDSASEADNPFQNEKKYLSKIESITDTIKSYSFYNVFEKLLNALDHCNSTVTARQVCWVFNEGICGLIKKIEKSNETEDKKPVELTGNEVSTINEILENVIFLIEQIMRSEHQLVQNPTIRPAIYSIPVSLLEIYLGTLRKAIPFLQSKEEAPKKMVYNLILPTTRKSITVEKVLEWDRNESISLILIKVPFKHVREPKNVIPMIIHEVAHYCGEEIRCRESRKRIINDVFSKMITSFLLSTVSTINKEKMFQSLSYTAEQITEGLIYLDDLTNTIQREINFRFSKKEFLQKTALQGIDSNNVISKVEAATSISEWISIEVKAMQNNPDVLNYYFHSLKFSPDMWNDFQEEILESIFLNKIRKEISTDFQNFCILLSEGFADIAMIQVLKLERNEYLQILAQATDWGISEDYPQKVVPYSAKEEMLKCAIQRFYTVQKVSFSQPKTLEECVSEFCNAYCCAVANQQWNIRPIYKGNGENSKKIVFIKNSNASADRMLEFHQFPQAFTSFERKEYFLYDEDENAEEYFAKCKAKIDELIKNVGDDERDTLKNHYENLKKYPILDTDYEFITAYRKSIEDRQTKAQEQKL